MGEAGMGWCLERNNCQIFQKNWVVLWWSWRGGRSFGAFPLKQHPQSNFTWTEDSDEEEDQTTKEPAIKSENEALRLSEMPGIFQIHDQEDLTMAISKATDLLQIMKFKKLKQSRIDDYYCKRLVHSTAIYDIYVQCTACFAHLISFTVQYCFLISFCLYRAYFTHLISSNLRCNLFL